MVEALLFLMSCGQKLGVSPLLPTGHVASNPRECALSTVPTGGDGPGRYAHGQGYEVGWKGSHRCERMDGSDGNRPLLVAGQPRRKVGHDLLREIAHEPLSLTQQNFQTRLTSAMPVEPVAAQTKNGEKYSATTATTVRSFVPYEVRTTRELRSSGT